MATSSFDKVFVIEDPKAQERLRGLLKADAPLKKIVKPSIADRERGERVLTQLCSHLKA